ncbi:MAG: GNAT family N-acetyltransferase [Vulcanimicrobiaceae bacterium]
MTTSFAPIETPRLLIRAFALDDLDALAEILCDPLTMQFWPRPLTRDEAADWLERSARRCAGSGFGRYAIVHRASGAMIGDAGVVPLAVNGADLYDLGYIIHHPYWRRGYATEAASAIRDDAFERLGLPALHANMPFDHAGSQRVAERIGMRKIGEFFNERNRNILTFLYQQLREDHA